MCNEIDDESSRVTVRPYKEVKKKVDMVNRKVGYSLLTLRKVKSLGYCPTLTDQWKDKLNSDDFMRNFRADD